MDNDQLFITDGTVKYRLYLQLEAAGSEHFAQYSICYGSNQVFKDSIIVSKLMYFNRDISTYYDFYLPSTIIVQRDQEMFDASTGNCMHDQGRFVVKVQAKSELLCKGSVDFIVQATIHSNDFSWLPTDLSYQAQKCCVCTVFIIFHGGKYKYFILIGESDSVKLMFLHSFLRIGQTYVFGKLRSSKIRFPNGDKKKILSYSISNSWFDLYHGALLEDVVVDKNFQMELSFPVPQSNLPKTKMISYAGVITKVLDDKFRFYEIDGKHQLFLGYCQDRSLNLISVGACITLSHAHIFTISDMAVFVGCQFTNVVITSTKDVIYGEQIPRRKVLVKYPTIRDFLVSRNLKSALHVILGDKVPDLSSVIGDIKNQIIQVLPSKAKEPTLFDFMMHNSMEECPVVFGHDNLPQILTPSSLLDAIKESDHSVVNPQNGYHFTVFSNSDLGFRKPFLLGILDSNETGILRLRDSLGNSISCCIHPESEKHLSFKSFRQLVLFSDFEVVIERYGYSSLEDLTTKVYVRMNLDSAHFWDIFVKRTPLTRYNSVFYLTYIRPIIWDLNPSKKVLSSCTLEGFAWDIDSNRRIVGEHSKMWIKLSGFASALVPFLKKERIYFIFGQPQKLDMAKDVFINITQENHIEEAEIQDLNVTKIDVTPEMPIITLQTFVLGYNQLKFSPGLTEELISIRAMIVSKNIVTSEPWESPCRLSSKELANTWNIGIGFSDRICILNLKDEFSHEEFSVYYDNRKLALETDLLPGFIVQFVRLGLQVSKNRKLYGVVLPVTSIEVMPMNSINPYQTINDLEIPEPMVKLFDVNQFSPKCRVLCSVSQIISISLKRQRRIEYGNDNISDISGTAIVKLEDGTMEATGHITSSDVIFNILSADSTQILALIDATKRFGEITYNSDPEKASMNSSHELLGKLAVSACTPFLRIFKVKFKYIGADYKIRTFNSKEDSVQIVCPPTLGVQIEGWEPLNVLCILHQELKKL
jgi:hypothetical protein